MPTVLVEQSAPTVLVEMAGVTALAERNGAPVSVAVGGNGNATHLRNRLLSTEAPDDGDVLSWNEGLGLWEPIAVPGISPVNFTDLVGFLDNSQIPVGEITLDRLASPVYTQAQVNALLDALDFTDIDGQIANGQVPVGAVTQHQASLSILESQIVDGALLARVGADETISGLYTFSNAAGLLTDVIGERTAAAGVTVDGLLIKDGGIPQAAVTAHQAALSIATTQLTGNMPDARIVASNVTQHQASLSITWSQISSFVGSSLAQLATRDANDLGGTTLNSGVVTSSLTTVGILQVLTVGTSTAGCHLDNNGSTQAISTCFVPEVVNNLGRFAVMTVASNSVASANTLGQFRWTITQADPSTLKSSFSLQVNTGDNLQDAITISDARAVALPGGTLVLGTLAASTGSHFEVQLATGAATITPVVSRLRTTTTSQAWVFGASNYWAAWEAYSDDNTSPPGASVRCRISVHAENSAGSVSGIAFWVGPTGGPTVAVTLNSDLTANFTGAIQRSGTQVVNTRRTGWTADPTGTLNRTTFVSDTETLPNVAARVAALIIDLRAHGLIGA